MHPSMFLLASVVFVVPTHAITALSTEVGRSEALYALNVMQAPGAQFGRFFDAAALSSAKLAELTAPRERSPFTVEIPKNPPAPFQRTFGRLMKKPQTDGYDALIRRQAEEKGLDPRLVKSVIAAESEFTRRAKSPAGALGLMQVKPATADEMGVSGRTLFDPAANIRAGTRYLAYLFSRAWVKYHLRGVAYTDAPGWVIQRVIAAYNAGPRWVSRRPMYRETREYVKKVLMFYKSEVSALRQSLT
jgi:soluble lytic murein transglycosylase-like protein